MRSQLVFKILTVFGHLLALQAGAQSAELQRLKGFAEHQVEQKQFDRQRERGEQSFLEEQEEWERQREKDAAEYKKRKKQREISENGPEFREDQIEKKQLADVYEKDRREFIRNQKEFDRSSHQGLISENRELGLEETRPRYEISKRAMYGATTKYSRPGAASSGSGSAGFSPPPGGGFSPPPMSNFPPPAPGLESSTPFPPPPVFDDFNEGGFPPPPAGDHFGDDFPPPPPPMYPDGEFDSGFGEPEGF